MNHALSAPPLAMVQSFRLLTLSEFSCWGQVKRYGANLLNVVDDGVTAQAWREQRHPEERAR